MLLGWGRDHLLLLLPRWARWFVFLVLFVIIFVLFFIFLLTALISVTRSCCYGYITLFILLFILILVRIIRRFLGGSGSSSRSGGLFLGRLFTRRLSSGFPDFLGLKEIGWLGLLLRQPPLLGCERHTQPFPGCRLPWPWP